MTGEPAHAARHRTVRRLIVAAWIAGAVLVWNGVFDAHIRAGARDYVDRQRAFLQGRGPRADIDEAMDAAKGAGLRAATLWAAAELAPGLVLGAWLRIRRKAA
jgi:hypothetical protein